jgi:hypothetical protein
VVVEITLKIIIVAGIEIYHDILVDYIIFLQAEIIIILILLKFEIKK